MSASIPLTILLFLIALPLSAAQVEDNCSDCHEAAPIPDAHPPMQDVGTEICGTCHQVRPQDPYLVAVHQRHQQLGVDCSYCHGDEVPPPARLEQLLPD